jgi:hypothetical protein
VTDLTHKNVLIWDASGSYTHIAQSLVPDFGVVRYFVPWEAGFPSCINALPGIGVDGLERCDDFFDVLDSTDLCIFTDVGMGGLQEWLRHQGMPVFGSGAAEKLERDRWYLKSVCKKVGIGTAEAEPIRGYDELRERLMNSDEESHIKISYWRGDFETMHHKSPMESRRRLDQLSLDLGPYGPLAKFLIEEHVEAKRCVEVGVDPPAVVDGMYPDTMLWGFEAKDKAYAGTIAPLPDRLRDTIQRLAPILTEFGYRGPLSTETRETPDGTYFLDATCRFPEPPSSLQSFMVANLGEVFWEAAHGRLVEPDYIAQIGVQIVIASKAVVDHPIAVQFSRPDRTAVHGLCVIDGQSYAVSPAKIEECIGAVGMANSLSDAMEEALEVAHSIKGEDLTFDESALATLVETIQTAESLGISWSGRQKEAA